MHYIGFRIGQMFKKPTTNQKRYFPRADNDGTRIIDTLNKLIGQTFFVVSVLLEIFLCFTIYKILRYCLQLIIRSYILYTIYGCNIRITGAIFECTTIFLINAAQTK